MPSKNRVHQMLTRLFHNLRNKETETHRWFSTLSTTTLFSGTAAVLSLIAGVLISRTLPLEDVGRYGLLISLIQILPILGALGQPALMKREYSLNPPGYFDWHQDVKNSLLFEIPSLIIVIAGSVWVYRLSPMQAGFIASAVLLTAVLHTVFEIMNAHRIYVWANLLLRIPNAMTLLPALLAFFFAGFARLDFILSILLIALLGSLLLGLYLLEHTASRGTYHLPHRKRWLGLSLMVLAVTHFVPLQGLTALGGLVVSLEELAALTALGVLFRPFNLLREVITQMMTVEIARNRNLNRRKAAIWLWLLGGALGGIAITTLPFIVPLLYGNRYDRYLSMILPLALTGAMVITEIMPRSFITARVKGHLIKKFGGCQTAIAVLCTGMAVIFGQHAGISGLVWAGTLTLFLRNLCAYGFYFLAARTGQVLPASR